MRRKDICGCLQQGGLNELDSISSKTESRQGGGGNSGHPSYRLTPVPPPGQRRGGGNCHQLGRLWGPSGSLGFSLGWWGPPSRWRFSVLCIYPKPKFRCLACCWVGHHRMQVLVTYFWVLPGRTGVHYNADNQVSFLQILQYCLDHLRSSITKKKKFSLTHTLLMLTFE